MASPYVDTYCNYVRQIVPDLVVPESVTAALEQTNWDDPTTPDDWLHCGVIALIEAEQADDLALRHTYVDMAYEALQKAATQPLGAAHLALLLWLIGEANTGIDLAFSYLIRSSPQWVEDSSDESIQPVYLPVHPPNSQYRPISQLNALLSAETRAKQSAQFLAAVLCQSSSFFYNASGQRMLRIQADFFGASALTQIKIGIAQLMGELTEGLLYLQHAYQHNPQATQTLQALFLGYRTLNQSGLAQIIWERAKSQQTQFPTAPEWQWVSLPPEHPHTYLTLGTDGVLAVEPSLKSIVTNVLLAEGDWFEREMEFWRTQIQPGMTVIDVGANAGVYTLSAAQRVGPSGRVLAVEPFSGCVQLLQETCRVNQIDWVTVCAGAASDRTGQAYLQLQAASELNELVAVDDDQPPENVEAVACFTLDSLIDTHQLDRVDFLKIDAEGHEISVLRGSDRLLQNHQPVIIYENISGHGNNNTEVGQLLMQYNYRLCRYQPYTQKLIPIDMQDVVKTRLNLIAIPQTKVAN